MYKSNGKVVPAPCEALIGQDHLDEILLTLLVLPSLLLPLLLIVELLFVAL